LFGGQSWRQKQNFPDKGNAAGFRAPCVRKDVVSKFLKLCVKIGARRNIHYGHEIFQRIQRQCYSQASATIQDARAFCQTFFPWYNTRHKHSGLELLTPEQVHYGQAAEILTQRNEVLAAAFNLHPQRFKGKRPKPLSLPVAVWINNPQDKGRAQ
jgi:hypothetical protein